MREDTIFEMASVTKMFTAAAIMPLVREDGDEMTFRLYPIGENEFGRKLGTLKLKFGDGCLKFADVACKKLRA